MTNTYLDIKAGTGLASHGVQVDHALLVGRETLGEQLMRP